MKLQQLFLAALLFILQACGGGGSTSSDSGNDNNGGDDNNNTSTTVEGRAIDGPLSGSLVFMDLNGNAIKDDNEPSTTSDSEGYFSISTANVADTSNAKLVVIGGTDTATNMIMDNLVLMSDMPTDLTQTVSVTPISSIIASVDTVEEKAAVLSALSIDKSLDEFLQMDPWALALQGDVEGQRIQQMSQKVAVMITSVQSMAAVDADLVAVSKDVFAAIAKEADDQEMVDFSSQLMLSDVIEEVLPAVDSALVTAAATSLVEANQLIEGEADITSSAASDVVEKIQTDYQDLLTDLVHSDSVSIDLGQSFEDTDNDGIVNLIDTDDDGDSVPDDHDYYPLDSTQSASPSVDNDSGSATNPAEFSEAFGGASYEGETFTFPSGAEAWAGFANMNLDLYPFTFTNGGTLSFTGAVPSGDSVNVRFRFEYKTYPEVDPAYDTQTVTVTGATEASYSISIPSQGNNTFSSLIMYVVERDAPVIVSNVLVSSGGGSDDSGSNDTGSDNTGSDDTVSDNTGVTVSDAAVIDEAFGGATFEGETFTFPSGAEAWAGFANMNTDLYPFSFSNGGTLSFTGAVPSGGTVNVRFRFEYKPYPDVDPAYDTQTVTVSGATEASYSISIPSQGNNTFSSLIMYVVERDAPVTVSNVVVSSGGGSDDSDANDTNSGNTDSNNAGIDDIGSDDSVITVSDAAVIDEAFGGATFEGETFTFPSGAETWAGFANMNTSLYPFIFEDGGLLSFTGSVPSGGTVNVRFRFEYNPYPDVDPAYDTQTVTVSGATETNYSISIPSQGSNTFSSLIMYVVDRNAPVTISNVVVTSTGEVAGSQGTGIEPPTEYNVINYGAGSIGDTIYNSNHRCKEDYGQWVENAGVISTEHEVQKRGCNQVTGIPTGIITKLYPHLAGPAANKPTQTHKWWGSVSFMGEMTVGDPNDAAYISPDPISARITNMGARIGSIPSGLQRTGPGQYYYPIPAHEAEVFDGIAVGNSTYSNLEAYTKDYSEGSVTVIWKSGSTDVMEATFVHGSPYVYFKAYVGNLEVRTLRQDGVGEKGTFSAGSNKYGIWTSVAGKTNNYLIVGEGSTSFTDVSVSSDPMTQGSIRVNNSAKEMTLVYLPSLNAGNPSSAMVNFFASKARNTVSAVDIDYQVNRSTNEITVTHRYENSQGELVDTITGMHPLHWKNSSQTTSNYKIRSARGMLKFAEVDQFNYQIPYVGVLPTMPTIDGSFDQATLEDLVNEFVNTSSDSWNTYTDTYWSGKNYGKVAELAAIARSIGMQSEANS